MTTGASYGLKGVASLILFLGLGLASSFLTLLSFCCLEEGDVQGPDIRAKSSWVVAFDTVCGSISIK